jgi:hypothetical protein
MAYVCLGRGVIQAAARFIRPPLLLAFGLRDESTCRLFQLVEKALRGLDDHILYVSIKRPVQITGERNLSAEMSVAGMPFEIEIETSIERGPSGRRVGGAAPKPLPGAAQQIFHVSALKMIAAKCP